MSRKDNYEFPERYLWEAEAHANELLEIYDLEERQQIAAYLVDRWKDVLPLLQHPPKTAFVFLGEDPTPQDLRLAKLARGDARLLWLQARYLALQATKALELVRSVSDVKERKYRKVVRRVAQAALPFQDQPSIEELLFSEQEQLILECPD